MNAYETIESFLSTLRCKEKTKKEKKKEMLELYNFIVENHDVEEDWDFKHIKKIQYKNKEFRIPLDQIVLLDFIDKKSPYLTDHIYNKYVSTLRQFGRYLFKRKILVENPTLEIPMRRIKDNDTSDKRLSFDECIRLLEAAYRYDKKHKVRNFVLVQMLLTTALRPGELCNLTEEMIDFQHGLLYGYGKTGWRKRILLKCMKESIKILLEDPERLKALERMEKRYLFYSNKGTQLDIRLINRLLKKIALEAGINKSISSYWLRRSFATMLANADFCIMEIKRIFDHDRLSSTQFYVRDTAKREIKELVNNSTVSNMLIDFIRDKFEPVN